MIDFAKFYDMANLLKEAGVQDAYNREWQLHVESLSMDSGAICIVQDVLQKERFKHAHNIK